MAKFNTQQNGSIGQMESSGNIPGGSGVPGPQGPAGPKGEKGDDGFSPTISVQNIVGGHTLTITDVSGTKTVNVMNGADGDTGPQGPKGEKGDTGDRGAQGDPGLPGETGAQGPDGPKGNDGFSPTVEVTDIEGGHQVTITDVNGPKIFEVMNGKDGMGGSDLEGDSTNEYTVVNAPIGAILPWYGKQESIPDGWHICDGEAGTVDLRDRFILGAGESYTVGESGGAKEVTLTIDQMPAHKHSGVNSKKGPNAVINNTNSYYGTVMQATVAGDSDIVNTGSTGNNQAHNNMPPYVVLYFIQKISHSSEDIGESAGFGEVTATVDDNVGIPEVTVTTSGPDTAKNFHFKFKNIKGEKGETGNEGPTGPNGEKGEPGYSPTVEVEDGEGEHIVTITDAEGPHEFTVHDGEKGDKGDPGSDIYSKEETVIGTWIDGKPLYRIAGETITSDTPKEWIDILKIEDVSQIVSIEGCCNLMGARWLPIPDIVINDSTIGLKLSYVMDRGFLAMYVGQSSYSNKKLVYSVKYTKTTD